ncbi:MAG TPA: AMP-binding protein, partial [Metalysinibacillus sp.]
MNLVTSLQSQAEQQPNKIAYHFMGKDTSYGELEHAVGKFAQALTTLGVKKGDHVALLLGNTPHFIVSLYASMRIGATVIPVNPIYTPSEISYIVNNGDVKVVIALDLLVPLVTEGEKLFPKVEHYIICETQDDVMERVELLPTMVHAKTSLFQALLHAAHEVAPITPVKIDDTAVILYTSGTTGVPKGAMLTHGNLYSNARDIGTYLQYTADDKVIATLPVFHVFALTVVVNAPLISGATIILVPKFSPKEVFHLVKEQQATVFAGVPTMFNFLYQLPNSDV